MTFSRFILSCRRRDEVPKREVDELMDRTVLVEWFNGKFLVGFPYGEVPLEFQDALDWERDDIEVVSHQEFRDRLGQATQTNPQDA